MAKGKRRRIKPADNQTPDLTPRCEAEDCGEFPFYAVHLPGLQRRTWLCSTHHRYWQLDAMRAKTRAFWAEHKALEEARIGEWAENHISLVARLEVEHEPRSTSPALDWRTATSIAKVVLDA